MRLIQPFSQGDLDGLCGVYSVLNTLKALGFRNNLKGRQTILVTILVQLYHDKQSSQFIIDGITTPDISRILKNIIKPEYEITYSKPFHSKAEIDIAELWDALSSHLKKQNRAAILCIEGKAYGHWTVVTSITERRITLFDSDKMQWLNRSQLTTTEISPKTPVYIYPTSLFLCKRS